MYVTIYRRGGEAVEVATVRAQERAERDMRELNRDEMRVFLQQVREFANGSA